MHILHVHYCDLNDINYNTRHNNTYNFVYIAHTTENIKYNDFVITV